MLVMMVMTKTMMMMMIHGWDDVHHCKLKQLSFRWVYLDEFDDPSGDDSDVEKITEKDEDEDCAVCIYAYMLAKSIYLPPICVLI